MITKFSQIVDLFKEMNKFMCRPFYVYTIGGAVLLEQELKETTKDIDLVVDTKEEVISRKLLKRQDLQPRILEKNIST